MDSYKHFSHPHGLTFHQMQQGTTIDCSGCKLPASGSVFVCFECKFYLHEQCYRATRSIDHPSHPLHPLTLAASPTYPSGSFLCNSCGQTGSGFSYTCSACDFCLHIHCACISKNTPHKSDSNSQAQRIQHKSHPKHALTLLSKPPYGTGDEFTCDGCGGNRRGEVYNCLECNFDLHVKCASLNEIVNRVDHNCKTPLTLCYLNPYKGKEGWSFECSVCHRNVPLDLWTYYCWECDYGTHINCVMNKERPKDVVEMEKVLEAQEEMSRIQMRLNLNTMKTQMLSNVMYGTRYR